MSDTSDPRIETYRQAALAMEAGDFTVELPPSADDDIGALGEALRRLADAISRKMSALHHLREMTEHISSGLLLDDVCDHVYEAFADLIPYDRIGLALLDHDGRMLRARWARSEIGEPSLVRGFAAPMAGSSLQVILDTGEPRILNDLPRYLADNPHSESTRLIVEEGVRSSLTCPLLSQGRPIGFLFFSSRELGCYADEHADLFMSIAAHLATVVEKGRLYNDLLRLDELRNRFLGMAAHDMRSPLMVIQTYTRLLLEGAVPQLPEDAAAMLQPVRRAAEQMIVLVNDLLDASVVESGHLELDLRSLDLVEHLRGALPTLQLMGLARQVQVDLEVLAQEARVDADPHRLDQALQNLVGNAVKYSEPGGVVVIEVRGAGSRFLVSVTDRGCGISEEDLPVLFAPFGRGARADSDQPSTGLGLAITRRLVEAHGGTLWVESELGAGSTFRFDLPAR